MTIPGEIPQAEIDGVLSPEQLDSFRDQELWPAINFLAHGEFVGSGTLGDKLSFERTRPIGCNTIRVLVKAEIWRQDNTDGSGISIEGCEAEIVIEEAVSRSTRRELMLAAGLDEIMDIDEVCGWETTRYIFSSAPGELPHTMRHMELRDVEEDEYLWSEFEGNGQKKPADDIVLSEDQKKMVEEMDDSLYSVISEEDLDLIRHALIAVGVDSTVFYGHTVFEEPVEE